LAAQGNAMASRPASVAPSAKADLSNFIM
jgi:hypothetical protein